jgi:hypothetical protein
MTAVRTVSSTGREESMTSKALTRTLIIALRVVMVIGIVAIVTLPWSAPLLLTYFQDAHAGDTTYRVFITAFYMIVGTLVVWGLGEAQAMLLTIDSGPFVQRNVAALIRCGWLASAAAILFAVHVVVYPDAISVLAAVAAFLIGLSCFTLSRLIASAVSIKTENDLTI